MADQNRWTEDRNRSGAYGREDRYSRGYRDRGGRDGGGRSEWDEGRSFAGGESRYEQGRYGGAGYGGSRAGMAGGGYGAERYGEVYRGESRGYGDRESEYGRRGQSYGGGGGYGAERYGEAYRGGDYGGQTQGGRGYPGGTWADDRQRYGEGYDRQSDQDKTWMERAGQRIGSWFGGEEEGQGRHRGKGPKNYTRSDERIREDVNDRLADDAWLDASDVDVQVKSCEVTLNGTVESRDDKRRAEDLAERISGVKHVQNNLRVSENATASTLGTTGTTTTQGSSASGSTTGQAGSTTQSRTS